MQRLSDELSEISNNGSYIRDLYTIHTEKCNDLYAVKRRKQALKHPKCKM